MTSLPLNSLALVPVRVNGETREVPPGTTLDQVVAELSAAPTGVAAAVNEAVVPRGAWAATGHHRNGVLLTPVTADALADYLTTGELPAVAAPFTPARFGSGLPTAIPALNSPTEAVQ